MTQPSSTGQPDSAGSLVELTADQCWELVRGEQVGRLAWNGPEGPIVVPVNFAVANGAIEVRTTAYSAAAHLSEDSALTFQLDRIDADSRTGWSVLARGQATFDWTYGRVDSPGVDVWPSGERALRITLEVTNISGRRLVG